MDNEKTTHFGYKQVPVNEKVKEVRHVFDSVAAKYDIMNDFMSMGIHRIWKKMTLDIANVKEGHKVLDLAGGTGDLALKFSKQVGTTGQVVLADINDSMLEVGRERLLNKGVVVDYAQVNAETLPFADNSFNLITIAFGLRNVTDKDAALASMLRVLKPGGRLLVLEFSELQVKPLRPVYDWYSFNILPVLGKVVTNDSESYKYLAESIRMHPNQEALKQMMEHTGFGRCEYYNLSAGLVALHSGYKL
ncbi:bifunctional demethylmenaquinone methyltransferase/2-methoxy-6-polyprenyl-1,4-benzoquinol methylase UbiE [Candidatus Albibeggiatoa sp. nov. BB20]|uniref:bifunctional demethylmenaquinone methyltransferase/2-methoxy-6-polyprenyl-1,4-benzoquinol methylase UbiE n=1 Tax=Candidatus Albibeggiatoa sp. nov. BB20 TaxID=3162723 RepID=UPI003365881C